MGLGLSNLLGGLAGAATGFLAGGPVGAIAGGAIGLLGGGPGQPGAGTLPITAPSVPSHAISMAPMTRTFQQTAQGIVHGFTTGTEFFPDPGGPGDQEIFINGDPTIEATPAALPAVVGGAVRITARLAAALARVATRLGFGMLTAATVTRFGGRLYRSLTAFARRHPGVSILAMLASLGMSAQEAAEFIAWGSTRRRRRRGGISGRDIRTTRRTLRRIASVRRALGGGVFAPRRGHHHHPRGGVV